MDNNIIFISGTPCTGKTTLSKNLANKLTDYNVKLISINDFAFSHDLILGIDEDKGYKIVDIENLDPILNKEIMEFISTESDKPPFVIVEGHLSHLCSTTGHVCILRLNPDLLKERLSKRNYSTLKINENLEAECLGVCSVEAYEHQSNVSEIDTSNLSSDELVDVVCSILFDNKSYPLGSVDYLNYITELNL